MQKQIKKISLINSIIFGIILTHQVYGQSTHMCLYNATSQPMPLTLSYKDGASQSVEIPRLTSYCDNDLNSSDQVNVSLLSPYTGSFNVDQSKSNDKATSDPIPLEGSSNLVYQLISGNWTNSYTLYNPAQPVINTNNWMSKISETTILNQIIMPGSHDAGMSQTDHCTFVVKPAWAKTQNLNIMGQENAGSRYYDIRVDYDHGELVTYHRTDSVGCNGQPLANGKDGVLDNVIAFLQNNPTETIILKFSHTRNDPGHKSSDIVQKVVNLLKSDPYQQYLFKTTNSSTYITNTQLGAVRGKFIAVVDSEYYGYVNPGEGIFKYSDYASTSAPGLMVFDQYSDTSDFDKMSDDQTKKLSDYGGLGQTYLFLLSWTLTGSAGEQDIEQIANTANGNLPGSLYNFTSKKPNIVYIDFINQELTQSIIQYNSDLM